MGDTTLDSVPQAITSDTTPDTTLDTTPDTTQDTTQDTAPAVAILADRFHYKSKYDMRKGYSFLNVFPSYISLFGTSCSVKLLLLFFNFQEKVPSYTCDSQNSRVL